MMMPNNKGHKGKHTAKKVAAANKKVNTKCGPLPVGKAQQSCSKSKNKPNTIHPCDIGQLKLEDTTSKSSLVCTKHTTSCPTAPPRIAELLKSHDLVMELVSDYELVTDTEEPVSGKTFVELVVTRVGKGNCPNHEHPSVELATSGSTEAKYSHNWKTDPPKSVTIPARPLPKLDRAISWIAPFWNFRTGVIDLTVTAEGCGVGFQSPVNQKFDALIRIYPNDLLELSFTVPPFKKWEKEVKHMQSLSGNKSFDSRDYSSSTFGSKVSSSSFEREKEEAGAVKWSSTKGEMSGKSFKETETKYEDGRLTKETSRTGHSYGGIGYKKKGDDGKKYSSNNLELTLTRNGEACITSNILTNIVKVIHSIHSSIQTIKDALDIVPKVGLTYSIEASVLEGSITGTWGNRIPEGPNGSGDRFTAVEHFFDIDVELKLFEASFDLGFGFEIKIPPVVDWFDAPETLEIVLKAAISASLDFNITYHAKSDTKVNHKVVLASEPKLKVYLEFTVNVMGKGLRSEGGVRGGFEGEASFLVSFSQPPGFEAKLGSKPIEVYGEYFYDLILWHGSEHWEHELVKEHTFYEGPLPPQ